MESIPTQIGRFRIVEKLGEGAMGTVYKAVDTLIQRTVAIKTIRLDVERGTERYAEVAQRVYHEARVSATLIHPNIVTLFDLGEHEGSPFLAMEFVEGRTLSRVIAEEANLSLRQVVEITAQIGAALDFAREKGIIHRDIKPGNIMIDNAGKVKVMDFGIAKLMDSSVTRTGSFVGTPSYISPEQASEGKVDYRSDLFSLGVVTYEMLATEKPFQGSTIPNLLYKIVFENPGRPRAIERWGITVQQWDRVFSRALAKDPEKRYQKASEFVAALQMHFLHESQTLQPVRLPTSSTLVDTAEIAGRTVRADVPMTVHQRVLEETELRVPMKSVPEPTILTPAPPTTRTASFHTQPAMSSRTRALSLAVLLLVTATLIFILIRYVWPGIGGGGGVVVVQVSAKIESQPPGAQIFLDGRPTSLSTPAALPLEGKPNDTRQVTLRLPCYREFSTTVSLKPGVQPSIQTVLVAQDASVEIRTEPPGASLAVDGKEAVLAPATIKLACGPPHKLVATLAGYRRVQRDIDANSVTSPLVIRMEKLGVPGSLDIVAQYAYQVYSGRTPLQSLTGRASLQLDPGTYQLRFVNSQILLNLSLPVVIESGKVQTVQLPAVGWIPNVSTFPENARICFDGELYCDDAPIIKLYLVAGMHRLTCRWADGRTRDQTFQVQPGAATEPIHLTPQ